MNGLLSSFGDLSEPHFWVSVVAINWINILLSGDNAIVIALACRSLPPKQRVGGMVIGTAVALAMRLVFAAVVSSLMLFPYIKLIGGVALLWIAIKLLLPETNEAGATGSAESLWRAVKLIALADVVMSLDNVIAIAAAADGNNALLIFGLGVSVPAIVAGATVIMAMLNYFPLLLWAGAGLLGWIAGDIMAGDPVVTQQTGNLGASAQEKIRLGSAALGAVGTVICGYVLRFRQARQSA